MLMIEPFRIKVVEPLIQATKTQRRKALVECGYNPFLIPARYVSIDLISDSGTGAMSAQQWAEMVKTREDFSGQEAYEEFVKTARAVTGFPLIQPVHQGRSAENLLFSILLKRGDTVLGNTHFETTRANIEAVGGRAVDIPRPEPPFYGNIDQQRLQETIRRSQKVRLVIMTVTNNINGGQAVSLRNLQAARKITRTRGIPFVLDASRFADNAWLIKDYLRSRTPVRTIARRMFDAADIAYLSSKKDGLATIGGFIGLRRPRLFDRIVGVSIRQESYPTSGGLAARDLAAMTVGLKESIGEDFLRYHITSLRHLARALQQRRVKIYEPVGGHGVVVKTPSSQPYAAFALAGNIFIATGIRGGVFGPDLRLAVPRRVYTLAQLAYVAQAIGEVYKNPLPRLRLVNRPTSFFNFFAKFTER